MTEKPIWKKLSVSGLERYVRICDVVLTSHEHLTGADRMQLICDLLEVDKNNTVDEINAACKKTADDNLEYNLIVAQSRRDAFSRY